MRLDSVAAVVILLLFAAGVAVSPRAEAEDPRGGDLAERSARAGLEYACAALAWDPAWRSARSSGLVQLFSDGPYRMAFVARVQPAEGGRFRVGVVGLVADYLRGPTPREEVRGAGGQAVRGFRGGLVRWTATLDLQVDVKKDEATGFPVATPLSAPEPRVRAGGLDLRDFPEVR